MEDAITRKEHEEYAKRVDAENDRQNRRIELLEESMKQSQQLTVSVEKLAQSLQSMVKEQEKQGKRLEMLESRDGEMWRKTVGYVVTAIVGIVIGYIFTQFGM